MIKKFRKNIFVSGRDEVAQYKEFGITAILNVCRANDEIILPPDFVAIHIPLMDNSQNPAWLKDYAVTTLAQLVEHKKIVLVHCRAGVSRSPYVAIRYIAESEHRTIEAVYQELMATFPNQIGISPLNYA